MKFVLLSGGSGKRLWPLSNDSRSKQFLKMLRNPEGELESMVQRVWRQMNINELQDSIYIATSKSQVDMIQSQIGPQVPLIVEPARRDTFPAIALASTYLYSIVGVGLNEVIAVLPVDPYVQDDFFQEIKRLEQVIYDSGADLALMGVKPTFASEKYGYIVPQKERSNAEYMQVSHFREKPPKEQAKQLIEQDALWNCGVFAFKLDYCIEHLMAKGLPIQYDEMLKQYDQLAKISFDYEIVEKAEHIVATTYNGNWKDLGTWNTLTEEMNVNVLGNGIVSQGSTNTHLINELDIPVTVLGIPNAVVATSPDGILVTEKSVSPTIKEVMKNFAQRPMYEERRWGWYKVLDYRKFPGSYEVLTKRLYIKAGKNISYQLHLKRSEVWMIISGTGEAVVDDQIRKISPGDVLQIPIGVKHCIHTFTDMEFIEVQTGSELVEEDIVRISLDWQEIEHFCTYKGV